MYKINTDDKHTNQIILTFLILQFYINGSLSTFVKFLTNVLKSLNSSGYWYYAINMRSYNVVIHEVYLERKCSQ